MFVVTTLVVSGLFVVTTLVVSGLFVVNPPHQQGSNPRPLPQAPLRLSLLMPDVHIHQPGND
ncbi:MAG: hypothetical protein ACRC8Y_01840 [Chroococcales cyanobacterium]